MKNYRSKILLNLIFFSIIHSQDDLIEKKSLIDSTARFFMQFLEELWGVKNIFMSRGSPNRLDMLQLVNLRKKILLHLGYYFIRV